MARPVQNSLELARILAIPRRRWQPEQVEDLRERWTSALKTSGGAMVLNPHQAVALTEVACWGGAFAAIPVGGGKTLLSALVPRVVPGIKRPLVLTLSSLVGKTEIEFREYRKDWILPDLIQVFGYQSLGVVSGKDFLDSYEPDLIFADECDALGNLDAGRTRRVGRYLDKHPECLFVCGTGTLWDRSIRESQHLMSAATRQHRTCPLPEDHIALDEWSRALDQDVPDARAMDPGALVQLCAPGENVREAFRRRVYESPGIILAEEPELPIPLTIKGVIPPTDTAHDTAFRILRTWVTPDQIEIEDGIAMWRHAREVACGFFSVWDPRAPQDWRDVRSDWTRLCRDILGSNRREIDTELQLKQAIDAHPEWYPLATEALAAWRAMEPTFVPNPVPVWFSDCTLEWIAAWGRESPGLIWTDRPCVGERLADLYGLPYYGEMGIDQRTGRYIEGHKASEGSIVVARKPNSTGRNLQYQWSRNLVVDIPGSGREWEQLLGRTHRPGQLAPRVSFEVVLGCVEDAEAFAKAYDRTVWAQETAGQRRKMAYAQLDVMGPEAAWCLTGAQWRKTKPPKTT